MQLIYQQACYFFRRDAQQAPTCGANGRFCLSCALYIRRVEGLDAKDHLNLVYSRMNVRTAFLFSLLSLLVSSLALSVSIVHSLWSGS